MKKKFYEVDVHRRNLSPDVVCAGDKKKRNKTSSGKGITPPQWGKELRSKQKGVSN